MKLDTEAHTVTLANKDVHHATASCCSPPAPTSAACGSTAATSRASTTCARSRNADAIREDTENAEHVVLVGGSYIATEVAATLTAIGRKSRS